MDKHDFIAIGIALVGLIPMVSSAKPVAKPTPKPQIVYVEKKDAVDYDIIIDDIERELNLQRIQLDLALSNAAKAQIELNRTAAALEESTTALDILRNQVEAQTVVLNETIDKYNSQLQETEKWKQKHAEALEKLWFWRKIAIAISSLIALYGVFLLLKLTGKVAI